MLVSTLFTQSEENFLRGYRLHITNLADRQFQYRVRFWITPPSPEPVWASSLNGFFALFGPYASEQETFRRDSGVYVAGIKFSVPPNNTVSVGIVPRDYWANLGGKTILEGYVTLNLPVTRTSESKTIFGFTPQSANPVKVLLNPETTMVNLDHSKQGTV